MKRQFKIQIQEGDWFSIPLENGGYGLGVIARKGRKGSLFGYFFGPKRERAPTLNDAVNHTYDKAHLCLMFGDLGLQKGEWPILGRFENWRREDWPLPEFGRVVTTLGHTKAWTVRYDEADIGTLGKIEPCSEKKAKLLPEDGLYGYVAVQVVLKNKLDM